MDADRPEDDAAPGDLVAQRYRLRTPLGPGATGQVWLATDEDLEWDVAVQRLASTAGLAPGVADELRQRAQRQGRAAARLRTAHTLAVLDVAVDDGDPWLVTEHFPSRDLAGIVASHHVLPVAQVAQIGAQLADALVDVHAAGILHRGITPATVLVGEGGDTDGQIRIADLGLDRDEPTGTGSHLIRGTAAYVAPEVARGERPTPASDVHALGATLFTCLEGTPPHGLDDDADLLRHRIATGRHRAPTRAVALEPVLLAMLDPDPAGRPAMAAVRDELASIAAGRRRMPADVLTDRTHLTPISFAVVGIASGVSTAAGAGDGGATAVGAATGGPGVVAVPGRPEASPRDGSVLRRRAAVAAVAAVAMAGVAAYLVATSSARAPAAAVGAAPTTAVTTAATTATVAPPTSAESEQAVRAVVSRLPADPEGALATAGPTLQAVGAAALRAYLAEVRTVALEGVTARNDGTVSAGLALTLSDASTRTEPVTFTVTRPTASAGLVVDSAPLAALVAAGGPTTSRAARTTTTTTTRATTTAPPARSAAPPARSSAPAPAPASTAVPTSSPPEVAPPTPPTVSSAATTTSTPPSS